MLSAEIAADFAVLSGYYPAAPDSLAWKIGPSGAYLTMRPRLMLSRATANHRLDVRG